MPHLPPLVHFLWAIWVVHREVPWTPQATKTGRSRTLHQHRVAMCVHVDQRHEPFGRDAPLGWSGKCGHVIWMRQGQAGGAHRTRIAAGRSGPAHRGTKFHHGLVPHGRWDGFGMSFAHPRLSKRGHVRAPRLMHGALSSHDTTHVPIDHGRGDLMGDGRDRGRGVGTDAGQRLQSSHHV